MEQLTPATLETFRQVTWTDTRNATFSQALEAGHTHCGWLIGRTTDLFGQAVALASHSVQPEKAQELTTRDTFGPLFGGLSQSADLQLSLESRLRQALDVNGSVEYDLTWKLWDMTVGEPICALRASARRTSDNDFGGWPKTPQASAGEGGIMEIREGEKGKYKLRDYAQTAGWPTTSVRDQKGGYEGGRIRNGKISTDTLDVTAMLTGPKASGGPAETESGGECLAGWQTPKLMDVSGEKWDTKVARNKKMIAEGKTKGCGSPALPAQAEMAGYPTPRAGSEEGYESRKARKGHEQAISYIEGAVEMLALPDMTGWKLNPRFSLWLMGYPEEWAFCGEQAMQ